MSDKPCSRDPECLEGHEGMVFRGGHWRDPETHKAKQARADAEYAHRNRDWALIMDGAK